MTKLQSITGLFHALGGALLLLGGQMPDGDVRHAILALGAFCLLASAWMTNPQDLVRVVAEIAAALVPRAALPAPVAAAPELTPVPPELTEDAPHA